MANFQNAVGRAALATSLVIAGGGICASSASAQIVTKTGEITSFYVSNANNYSVRVGIETNGVSELSGCANGFAYVNKSFDNYDVLVSMLLVNRSEGREVTLHMIHDENGLCRIIEAAS